MNSALILPEIVSAIVEHQADSIAFLKGCVRINQRFYHAAVPFLWRHVGTDPSVSGQPMALLIAITSDCIERGQFYAKHVAHLSFFTNNCNRKLDPPDLHIHLYKLSFPGLKSVEFGIGATQQLLLDQLALCQRLVSITFSSRTYFKDEHSAPPEAIAKFIRSLTSLQEVDYPEYDHSWSPVILEALLHCSHLRKLKLPYVGPSWSIGTVTNGVEPLGNLRELHIVKHVSSKWLEALLSLTPQLRKLVLYTARKSLRHPSETGLLVHVCKISTLREFGYYPCFTSISTPILMNKDDILGVARHHPLLTSLTIGKRQCIPHAYLPHYTHSLAIVSPLFGDKELATIAKSLPQLKRLEFEMVMTGISEAGIFALGQSCSQLQVLTLDTDCKVNLASLVQMWQPGYFSNLEWLWIGQAVPLVHEYEDPEKIGQQLCEIMPRLEALTLEPPKPCLQMVLTAFEKHRRHIH